MTHWLHKTDGDTEAQGGEGTHLERHSQAVAEGASGISWCKNGKSGGRLGGERRRPGADIPGTCDKAQAWLT